jgi:hypothetical protein
VDKLSEQEMLEMRDLAPLGERAMKALAATRSKADGRFVNFWLQILAVSPKSSWLQVKTQPSNSMRLKHWPRLHVFRWRWFLERGLIPLPEPMCTKELLPLPGRFSQLT